MFGYVRPVEAELSEADRERYRAAYCGLCHTLGRRYGFWARMTLNYDFTLLAMLFAPVQPEICERWCAAHPIEKRKCCAFCGGLDLAADESIILFWQKLRDDGADKGVLSGLPARGASLALEWAHRRAAERCPVFDGKTARCLERLNTLERERCPSIDRTADAFAELLKAAVPPELEENRRRVLEQLLYHLGRWIYLIDAWDDLEQDRKAGRYNPLEVRFGGAPEEHRDDVRTTLTHSARLAASAFRLADFGVWSGVIENILCRGLPVAQEAVLTGCWKEISSGIKGAGKHPKDGRDGRKTE